MTEYLGVQEDMRYALAHLYAAVDGAPGEGEAARARAAQAAQRARRLLERGPLNASQRAELLRLVNTTERLLTFNCADDASAA